jgi:hypothetical protein
MSLDIQRTEAENSHQTAIDLAPLRGALLCGNQQPSEQPPDKNGHLLPVAYFSLNC